MTKSVIPCLPNTDLQKIIDNYIEALKTQAHTLGDHGLPEEQFYELGVFRGAIEKVRGQFSATMYEKRQFVSHVLNYMEDAELITSWFSAGESNRHDYTIELPSGRTAVIELKGCLDGNNTNIFDRPPHAHEFYIWSVCTNPAANPQHNVWSGIHTRLSADIVSRGQRVDGLIVWDWLCSTMGRPCPKLLRADGRSVAVGPYQMPPPCIYIFPGTIPSPRNNPDPAPQTLHQVEFLRILHEAFNGMDDELNFVRFAVGYKGTDTTRATSITRDGNLMRQSKPTPIRRT